MSWRPPSAPLHVRNIETLARAAYFDGLPMLRVQDDYVAQWGDPDNRHPIPPGVGNLEPEFDSPLPLHQSFTRLPDGDVYAPEVGFSDGFPTARSAKLGLTWLAHCYGMVGVGRDTDPDNRQRRLPRAGRRLQPPLLWLPLHSIAQALPLINYAAAPSRCRFARYSLQCALR